MNCDDCIYTDIADWVQDGDTQKAKPVYWCERYNKFCDDVAECKYKDEGAEL